MQGCAGTRIPPPSPVLRLHPGSWAGRWGQQAPKYQELDTASCRDAHSRQLPKGVTQARGKIRVFPARSRRGDAAQPSAQEQLATRLPASTKTSPKKCLGIGVHSRDGVLKAKCPHRVCLPHQSLLVFTLMESFQARNAQVLSLRHATAIRFSVLQLAASPLAQPGHGTPSPSIPRLCGQRAPSSKPPLLTQACCPERLQTAWKW